MIGSCTALDWTATTRPQPRSAICGSRRAQDRHRREHERAVRGLPLLAREAERIRVRRRPAGVGDVDVDRAERGLDAVEQSGDRVEVVGVVHEALRRRSRCAAASTVSCVREATATRTPSAASAVAIPRPIPFEPPVTSATRPSMPEVHAADHAISRARKSRVRHVRSFSRRLTSRM